MSFDAVEMHTSAAEVQFTRVTYRYQQVIRFQFRSSLYALQCPACIRCKLFSAIRLDFFLPGCMECEREPATRKLSVRPSVCLSNAWIVTK